VRQGDAVRIVAVRHGRVPLSRSAPGTGAVTGAGTASARWAGHRSAEFDPFAVWPALMAGEKPGGHGERCVAVGCLDMALWDLAGKLADEPVHHQIARRLHRVPRRELPVYAAGGYRVAAALGLGGAELTPLAFQPFGGPGDGTSVRAGRLALPDAPGIGFETRPRRRPRRSPIRCIHRGPRRGREG